MNYYDITPEQAKALAGHSCYAAFKLPKFPKGGWPCELEQTFYKRTKSPEIRKALKRATQSRNSKIDYYCSVMVAKAYEQLGN